VEVEPLQHGWHIYFERSIDNGRSWSAGAPVASPQGIDAIQPSVLVHSPTRLQALGRTRSGRMFQAWSEDAGQSWSALELMDLPNCNSGTDAVTLRDGRHLLVYNHSSTEKVRFPLNLAISRDGGNWEAAGVLESEPPGQYSYPAVIQADDGVVHITYTWKREKIRHVALDPRRLKGLEMAGGAWPAGLGK
jgi:alpha-L-rhamnosidase